MTAESSPAGTSTALPDGAYNIDTVHSSAGFALRYGVGTFRAGFAGVTGGLADGVLSGTVQVDDIILPTPFFKEQLLSEAWFDAASHPVISWKSTSITPAGDGIELVGELTIKGITKEIKGTGVLRGPALIPIPGRDEVEMLGIDITAEVNAADFGVGNGALGGSTTLEISLTLHGQAAGS